MPSLNSFPITKKWSPTDSNKIQLYSLPTPNGIKVSAMLEETGLAYEAHLVDFSKNDQTSYEFLSLNPNNKIPAIIDPNGPNDKPLGLWESGAILLYLAEKSDMFLPEDPAQRFECIQWLMWQMGGLGPMFGQYGFFHKFAGKEIKDKTAANRYRDEAKRLLAVLDEQLAKSNFIVGNEYTIADIAIWPWIRAMIGFYDAAEDIEYHNNLNIIKWYDNVSERKASLKAVSIPPRD